MQTGVPISDTYTGTWNIGPLFNKLDENIADDSDFIFSANHPQNEYCEVKLTSLTDPLSSSNHTIYVRNRNTSTNFTIPLTVDLYQSGTLIASRIFRNFATGYVTNAFTLTTTETNSITDYSNLRLRLTAGAATGSYSFPLNPEPTTYPLSGEVAYSDTSNNVYKLMFSGSGVSAIWQHMVPSGYYATPCLDLVYAMQSTSGGNIQWAAEVWAVSTGNSIDSPNYDSPNLVTTVVPSFSGYLGAATIPLINNDNMKAGDFVQIKVSRSGSTATGDAFILGLGLTYFSQ